MDFLASLFNWLTGLLNLHPVLVLSASFLWGILSVVLSPCHLSGIPLAVGYINGKGKMEMSRALRLSLFFSLGILISLLALGVITSLAGRMLGDAGRVTTVIIGIVFVLVGISSFDFIPIPKIPFWKLKIRSGSPGGALVLGILFGAALGPCTFGFMMPVLSVVFRTAATNAIYSVLLLLAYAVGHCLVIVFAGTFVNWVQKVLNWEDNSGVLVWFRRICGVLIILTGIYLIFSK